MSFQDIVRALSAPDIPGGGHVSAKITHSGRATAARLAVALASNGKHPVILCRDSAELAEFRGLLTLFGPSYSAQDITPSVPMWEHGAASLPGHPLSRHGKGSTSDRIAAMYSLHKRSARCTLVAAENFLLRFFPLNTFENLELTLGKGTEIPRDMLLDQLAEWGYSRVPMVSAPGEMAVRGDIVDVYCPGYPKPLRFEFFDELLEDIRVFDQASQRSVAELSEATLLPVSAVSPSLKSKALDWWERLAGQGLIAERDLKAFAAALDENGPAVSIERYFSGKKSRLSGALIGACYENSSLLEEWLPANSVFLLPGELDLAQTLEEAAQFWYGYLEKQAEESFRQPRSMVMRTPAEALSMLQGRRRVYFEDLHIGIASQGEELPERPLHAFQDVFSKPAELERPWHTLVAAMHEWSRGKNQVLLSFSSGRSRDKFLNLAAQDGIKPHLRYQDGPGGLYALVSPFRRGAALGWDSTLILGEDVIQPRSGRSQRPSSEAFKGLDRYDDLQPGDHLVHRDYGIAAFGGLHHLNMGGVENDYLLLLYSGDDRLYLPVDRLGLIQTFKTGEAGPVALDKLGGSKWLSSKEKARKAIEQIAQDLVEMYAYRKVAKGFRYGPPDEMFREFEASFGFEETPDQARAIEEVLADMEKPEPMDRLICGDVGFGKTEVALRAAFRAALEGRQVALLCPTTVLAEQHYQTFRARLAGFPVNAGLLSRFVPRQKQKEVLEAAAKGHIDILIGTHRILSGDVSMPNLGLLILDEEQRFGVRHKEKLKQLRKNVDVLTLSATPIPRTLQLSMSGVRELSVIETAPLDRKPVATTLMNRDDAALKQIIERELAREGQVFWVYNRVQGLERTAEYVRKLCPQARVGMAHGQMGEKELEESMRRFWHGELDVLVCTAIIESGLDFPRANTLVVDQAQLFGLGQLYQLRGRVGRSDRQAFAVFITPDVDALPEITRRRLRIILDMDYLGAGFQVAMEDLRLRGAGNILGESQSGHMNRIGLDLFLEMLEEEVAKMRGKPLQEVVETEINLGVVAHIPEEYIADSGERLRYYKALSSAVSAMAQQELELELRDRFGALPEALENFLAVLRFKRNISSLGALKADIFADRVRLFFHEKLNSLDPLRLVAWAGTQKDRVRLHQPAGLEARLNGLNMTEKLAALQEELNGLCRE